jgi:hypothetical protein
MPGCVQSSSTITAAARRNGGIVVEAEAADELACDGEADEDVDRKQARAHSQRPSSRA